MWTFLRWQNNFLLRLRCFIGSATGRPTPTDTRPSNEITTWLPMIRFSDIFGKRLQNKKAIRRTKTRTKASRAFRRESVPGNNHGPTLCVRSTDYFRLGVSRPRETVDASHDTPPSLGVISSESRVSGGQR